MAWTNTNIVTCVNLSAVSNLTQFPSAVCSEVEVYNDTNQTFYVSLDLTAPLQGKIPVFKNTMTTVYGLTNANQLTAIMDGHPGPVYAVAKYYSGSVVV